jgi:hypothetical protein
MGQFKPMVKMMTTEPTVELKLKKGGSVKKADGGMMGSPMSAEMPSSMPSSMPARGGLTMGKAPMKPSMANRRKAMMGRPMGRSMTPPMAPPMASPAPMSATPMKEGGKADMSQDKAMIKKAFKQHDMQEHKGGKGTKLALKKGGMMGGGKMATGGVAMSQGGYKAGGIISTEGQGGEYRNTKMHTAKSDHASGKTGTVKLGNGGGYKAGGGVKGQGIEGNVSGTPPGVTNTKTGGVRLSNAGGFKKGGKIKGMMGGGMMGEGMMDDGMSGYGAYKKGGSAKKYARGGAVVQDDGGAQEMPQGRKKPSAPVSITALSGTFKKGGSVRKMSNGGDPTIDRETARMNAEKASEKSENQAMREAILGAPSRAIQRVKGFFGGVGNKPDLPSGSVTKTKESVTVAPSKKRGGSIHC